MPDNIFQRPDRTNVNIISARPLTDPYLDALRSFIQTPFFEVMHDFLTRNNLSTNVFKRIQGFGEQARNYYNNVPLFSIAHHTRRNGWIMRIPLNQVHCAYFSTPVISSKGLEKGQCITINDRFNYFIPNDQVTFLDNIDQYLNLDEVRRRLGW